MLMEDPGRRRRTAAQVLVICKVLCALAAVTSAAVAVIKLAFGG
jgi:hypothetical protein